MKICVCCTVICLAYPQFWRLPRQKIFSFFPQTASQEDCLSSRQEDWLCYLNGSPWAPRNWFWWQCGLRVHRIKWGLLRGLLAWITSTGCLWSLTMAPLLIKAFQELFHPYVWEATFALDHPNTQKWVGMGRSLYTVSWGYPKNITVESWEVCLSVTFMGLELCGILWWNKFRAWK